MNTTWIYKPRSGDRVFVEKPGDEVAIVEWPNGCRHVVGGVHLQYWAAECGSWWRDKARSMAAKAIESIGQGVAWDNQGHVHMVVPVRFAWQVAGMMEAAAGDNRDPGDRRANPESRNGVRLVLAGVARLVVESGHIRVQRWANHKDQRVPRRLVLTHGPTYEGSQPSEDQVRGGIQPLKAHVEPSASEARAAIAPEITI